MPRRSSKADASLASHAFRGRLTRAGMMYVVDVPQAVTNAVGARGYVPVAGVVNGDAPFRASLIPCGGGRHRILLNGAVRKLARIGAGDRVAIELRVDRAPRGGPTPEDVADALREEGVLDAWESLAPGKRMHILNWVDQAVHEETRAKRIARTVEVALAEREKRLDRESARAAKRAARSNHGSQP